MYRVKNKNSNKQSFNKHLLLIPLVILAGAGLFVWQNRKVSNVANTDSTINYSPPTETDKEEADSNKEKIVEDAKDKAVAENNKENTTPSGTKSVKPTITFADATRVNAYVSGIFEEGGSCKATFTKAGTTLTKTTTGFENVSYTQCAPFNLEQGFLSGGEWSVIVSYSSGSATGSSDSIIIKVN